MITWPKRIFPWETPMSDKAVQARQDENNGQTDEIVVTATVRTTPTERALRYNFSKSTVSDTWVEKPRKEPYVPMGWNPTY